MLYSTHFRLIFLFCSPFPRIHEETRDFQFLGVLKEIIDLKRVKGTLGPNFFSLVLFVGPPSNIKGETNQSKMIQKFGILSKF